MINQIIQHESIYPRACRALKPPNHCSPVNVEKMFLFFYIRLRIKAPFYPQIVLITPINNNHIVFIS